MATEDLTTYTEVDPNNKVSITSTTATITQLSRDTDAYVYKDCGADQLSNFKVELEIKFTSWQKWALCMFFGVSNVIANAANWTNGIMAYVYIGSDSNSYIYFYNRNTTTTVTSDRISLSVKYYITIERVDDIATLYIYTDSDKTNLFDSIQLTNCGTDKWRYFYVMSSNYRYGSHEVISGTLSNYVLKYGQSNMITSLMW